MTDEAFARQFGIRYVNSLRGLNAETLYGMDLRISFMLDMAFVSREDWSDVKREHGERIVDLAKEHLGLQLVIFDGGAHAHKLVPGPYQNDRWAKELAKKKTMLKRGQYAQRYSRK